MMPWHVDALLPTAERYASERFNTFARWFNPYKIGYADACEFVAFHETVGRRAVRYIFQWTSSVSGKELVDHLGNIPEVKAMIEQNHLAASRADGLAVLKAMQDGGWRQGPVPPVVRLALLDMRDAGISQPKIGRLTGLTLDQVRVMANGPRRRAEVGGGGLGMLVG